MQTTPQLDRKPRARQSALRWTADEDRDLEQLKAHYGVKTDKAIVAMGLKALKREAGLKD